MAKMSFDPDQKATLVKKLQRYFADELDQTLDQFPAEFLLAFIAEELGPHFYNSGLLDAQAVLASKLDDIGLAIDELLRPVD
ncbi:MAG: DUF2164 domain-containing protein [Pseudomonadota bacterium]